MVASHTTLRSSHVANSFLRILVVDDSKDDLLLTERVIKKSKILNPVFVFASGRACIDFIREQLNQSGDQLPSPSLIFLDLAMGEVGGIDVLRFIHSHSYSDRCIPVILSGADNPRLMAEAKGLGVRTLFGKPVTRVHIVELLDLLNGTVAIEDHPTGYMLHWNERSDRPTKLSEPGYARLPLSDGPYS